MTDPEKIKPRILVVTGGYLTEKETSFFQSARKLVIQTKASKHAWLDFKIKLNVAELLIKSSIQKLIELCTKGKYHGLARAYTSNNDESIPDLTEVVLSTLLENEGIPYLSTTYHELFSDRALAERLLETTECVFASTTLLHDMSELEPLIEFLNRDHNKIVLGGALVSSLGDSWPGSKFVDLVAVGYGEFLVPALAQWLRSGYKNLVAPERGRLETRHSTRFLYAGLPKETSLDGLERPNWEIALKKNNRHYKTIYYESVRGCPFRCSFCNYPYLFDDTKFRYKSAEKIAEDWQWYKHTLGVETIVCLDSLFTVPKDRVRRLCELLIERDVQINWVCYARADDLSDLALVKLMKNAGLVQVQIGVESADQTILDNMNKRCDTDDAGEAILNCRNHGITTVISLIVGFPGETAETLETTYKFLSEYPPDFYYLATFSTRIEGVPVLSAENRAKFGLQTFAGYHTSAPYWKHDTMDCSEAVNHVRKLNQKIMSNKISLNGMVFFSGLYRYNPVDREDLLQYQQKISSRHRMITGLSSWLHHYIDGKLEGDFNRYIKLVTIPSDDSC